MPDHPTFTEEELKTEIWKAVPGWEGYYEVSNLGHVRSLRRQVRIRRRSGISTVWYQSVLLKPGGKRYLRVALAKNGRVFHESVHVLVAVAFKGPRPKGKTVNHEDGNKLNNRASNLEWKTHQEQVDHAKSLGLWPIGDRSAWRKHPELIPSGDRNWTRRHPELLPRGEWHPNATLTDADVNAIRELLTEGWACAETARRFGVGKSTILRIKFGLGRFAGLQPIIHTRHGRANFNDAEIKTIRDRLHKGDSCADIARDYGVDYRMIWKISKRLTYQFEQV